MKLPISAQLYTVRDLAKNDFVGTIKEVARIGYRAIELAGYGNLSSAKEVRKAADDAGLTISSAHASPESLEDDLDKVLDEQEILGSKIVICPWIAEDRRQDADGWKRLGQTLTHVGEQCQARGIQLAYHNHSFEFQKYQGVYGFDLLLQNSDANFVKLELDVYWLKHGGVDPVAYIDENSTRTVLLHLKDMARGEEQKFAEVGEGILDFKAIATAGQKAGVKWYIVEQDNCYGANPVDCLKRSLENLKKMGLA